MRWKALIFLFLLLPAGSLRAQFFDSSLLIPEEVIQNNSFKAFFLVDSFSKAGDSLHASAFLMQTDPYYLMSMAYTPAKLDTFFSDHKLMRKAKSDYRKKFESIYNVSRTPTFQKFEKMLLEDQEIRSKVNNCRDSVTCAFYEQKMTQTDSVHFEYLFNYVKKYGWPKLADGSLAAELLALHDGTEGHQMYYLPIIKKAVLNGQANPYMYYIILNRAVNPTLTDLVKKYKSKVRFDVSCVLKSQRPTTAQMEIMKAAVKKNTPIKYLYFIYGSANEKDFKRFMNSNECYWLAWDILVALQNYERALLQSDPTPFYQFGYSESSIPGKKLVLYLLY